MLNNVSFLGLGSMGMPMALNLLRNDVKLCVYNRTLEKAMPLVNQGAELLASPDMAFEKADVAITMVANDEALRDLSQEILRHANPGSIHISMSTVSINLIKHLTAKHAQRGVSFVSAPVFGRPDVAATGKLWICMAGDKEIKSKIEPLLLFMGQKVYDFGEEPYKANAVKLSGNFLILSLVELLSESFNFAKKNGIDQNELLHFLTDSLLPSPVVKTYGQIIIDKKFTPAAFKMTLGLKDIQLFLEASSGLNAPLADLLHEKMLYAISNGMGDMDWSAVAPPEVDVQKPK